MQRAKSTSKAKLAAIGRKGGLAAAHNRKMKKGNLALGMVQWAMFNALRGNQMTTQELIAELQRLDPSGKAKIEIPVGTYTKAYPVAYLEPYGCNSAWGCVRICVTFPEGYSVAKRKGMLAA